ncbi:hypothetical protein [Mesorhizobium sanjuanii]|uniref:hypothetical protein n=1 Tax=Mesorhizobium sanjuanii TaxID=2037900 RepID=UPI0010552BF9|nr:hypothetical protein [Mesorhizobium sanjuanii]
MMSLVPKEDYPSETRRLPQGKRLMTKVSYVYRDASNYKFWGEFRLLGKINIETIGSFLFDGEYFIPEKIGLPPLRPDKTNEDDHLLHSLEACEAVEDCTFSMTVAEFARRIRRAHQRGWFY